MPYFLGVSIFFGGGDVVLCSFVLGEESVKFFRWVGGDVKLIKCSILFRCLY